MRVRFLEEGNSRESLNGTIFFSEALMPNTGLVLE